MADKERKMTKEQVFNTVEDYINGFWSNGNWATELLQMNDLNVRMTDDERGILGAVRVLELMIIDLRSRAEPITRERYDAVQGILSTERKIFDNVLYKSAIGKQRAFIGVMENNG